MSSVPPPAAPPPATLKPIRRPFLGWFWVLPLAVLLIVAGVLLLSWSRRGERVRLRFSEGHGLKPGDGLRCRGITVGEVRSVALASDLQGVEVLVDLEPSASAVAVEGSRFWIVRPQADLTGLSGLDTVVGAKYVAVLPGTGSRKRDFVGMEEPPLLEGQEPGGLEVVLQAERLGGLRPGVPLTYRQVRIGQVTGTRLASDASAVEVHVHIQAAHRDLVRDNSVFWNVSGFKLRGGLSGLTLAADSAETVLAGGVAMATPPSPGSAVHTGRRFPLAEEPKKEWLDWKPSIALTDPRLPSGVSVPRLARATLQYRVKGTLYGTTLHERRGLVLPLTRSVLGPGDVLTVPTEAIAPGELAFEGKAVPVSPGGGGGAWRRLPTDTGDSGLPLKRLRVPTQLEDCLIVGDGSVPPRFIPAARLTQGGEDWGIDGSLTEDLTPTAWHGAAAVAVKDGAVIGILLVRDKGPAVIAPLRAEVFNGP